jgi:drug/metabolite transporter (DMT)-like permease
MGLLVVLPFYITAPVIPDTPREWLMVAGVVFCSLTAQLLMNQGFAFCRGWEGGVFMTSEVIFTALIGIVFLHDPATWRFWTGGLLIVGSVVVLNVYHLRARPLKPVLPPDAES